MFVGEGKSGGGDWGLVCVCVCAEPQATASVLKQDPKVMAQKHCLDHGSTSCL